MPPSVAIGSITITQDPVFNPESFLLNLVPKTSRGYSDAYFHNYKPQDRAEGHWWGCSFTVTGRENVLKELYENGLGRRIEVWGYGLEVDFEARIYEIRFNYPPDQFIISLRSMANSAHMRADLDDDGAVERSTVLQNSQSIDLYGQTDGVLSGGELANSGVADQAIQSYIDLRGLPKPSANFQGGKGEMSIEIFAKGYVTTLSDRLYNQTVLTGTQSLNSQVEDVVGTRFPLVSLLTDIKQYYTLDEASAGAGAVTREDKVASLDLTDNNTTPSEGAVQGNGIHPVTANTESLSRGDEAALEPSADITVAAWIKFDSIAASQHLVGKWQGGSGQYSYVLYLDSAGPNFEFHLSNDGTATAHVADDNTIAADIWYFVVAYYDSVNDLIGISVNADTTHQTTSHTTGIYAGGTSPFHISMSTNGADAVIDEVGIWDRVLTQNEITALYNGGVGVTYNDFADGFVLLEGVGEFIDSLDDDSNTTAVSKEYDIDRKALDIIFDLVRLGDSGNNRWLFGVQGRDCTTAVGRKAILKQASPVKPPVT